MFAFRIDVEGCAHFGAWQVTSFDTLEVRSLYGTWFVPLGGQEPGQLARATLRRMAPPLVKPAMPDEAFRAEPR